MTTTNDDTGTAFDHDGEVRLVDEPREYPYLVKGIDLAEQARPAAGGAGASTVDGEGERFHRSAIMLRHGSS
ncbi:hypothetical protein [Umezawaea beigongshangensis]|uniref:hypothetical protein n=1 Tax=Umezawaea beigongshangensis TaxID=2780383 RepID=UPI0018F1278C|nr:hypothetical protein [Umezawaea beigongshangensis]